LPELALVELGSNIDPERHLPPAVGELARRVEVIAVSHMYQTEPFGPAGQPDFVNGAVGVTTSMTAAEIRRMLRSIEDELGRERTTDRYAPRRIDLDLCMVGERVVKIDGHRLPDPDILKRPYLAQTLAEVAPNARHPIDGRRLVEIAAELCQGLTFKPRPDVERAIESVLGDSLAAGEPA
jgi:2-amino-4-hydroxy-6-hydroxymethyldihydropteridine diphosphokinase